MLESKAIEKIVFLDIETVPQYEHLSQAPARMQNAFKEKMKREFNDKFGRRDEPADKAEIDGVWEHIWSEKAPLMAEFNKIVCISLGVIDIRDPKQYKINLKTIAGDDEKKLLQEFLEVKSVKNFNPKDTKDNFAFCAHCGLLFDFPMLAKRVIYNGLELPYILDYSDKKPWEVDYIIDTNTTWKYGVFDGGVSLDVLAMAFDVDSSKMLMRGSDVKDVYYLTKDMAAIKAYCEHDVFTLASIYLKMKNIQVPLVK